MADYSRIARELDLSLGRDEVPGAAVAVAVGGKLVFEHYCGAARPDLPAGPDVLWPIASISKLYTAAVVMRLIEQGVLTLSQRVETILPRFTGDGREKVRLRHLMTHTSGLPYESPQMATLLANKTPMAGILEDAYTTSLLFSPGSRQSYSDLGYALAGEVAAVATGISFPDLVRTLVLEPAGLDQTFMPPPVSEHARIAQVVGVLAEGTDGAMYNSAYALGLAHPAFGTVATVRDLLAFGLLFTESHRKSFLSPAGLRTMVTDQTGSDFPGEMLTPPEGVIHGWGVGWILKGHTGAPDLVSPESYGHQGASGCILWVDPTWDVAFAYVSNRHINLGWDVWQERLDRVSNVVMAVATSQAGESA